MRTVASPRLLQCERCGMRGDHTNFSLDRSSPSGFSRVCKSCTNEMARERRRLRSYALPDRAKQLARESKASAKQRGFNFAITDLDIVDLWHRQNGRCAYTGIDMLLMPGFPQSVSVDRIDSNQGYRPGNIALACKVVNFMKRDLTLTAFAAVCEAVADRLRANPEP